ncbi:MAG: 3-keto-5-aminohexanoate cleavage protein [Pseudohongiellaceae bacterium]
MTKPVVLSVAPNGAHKTKTDHPMLPLSEDEIAAEATRCQVEGATVLHLHVRDKNQAHTLDPERYLSAIQKTRAAVGDSMIIQITTEAVEKYSSEDQINCVKKVRPEAVSLALRELIPNQKEELRAARFFEWMHTQGIGPQYILYSEDELIRFNSLCSRGIIQSDTPNILLVLGKQRNSEADAAESDPASLESLVKFVDARHVWSVCAFGSSEAECMAKATSLGGHCRVGFENNLLDSHGRLAVNNAQQVAGVANIITSSKRSLGNINDARKLFDVHR